jgi:hypothetical protein
MFTLLESEKEFFMEILGHIPVIDDKTKEWLLEDRKVQRDFEEKKKDDELRAKGIAVSLSDLLMEPSNR